MVVAVLAPAVGAATLAGNDDPAPRPDLSSESLHLPQAVNAPGAWSDDVGPDGPLAVLGLALRTEPEGVNGERELVELYGVSAVDGRAAWIDLPGIEVEDRGLVGWFALSPDGRWIGWSRHRAPHRPGGAAPMLGWAVMDTTTREVRTLADPSAARLRDTMSDLVFSGDSRYLLTSYATPEAPGKRGHQFVAWDVENGTRTVLEEPGHYWLPSIGSAPTGVVWSRGRNVTRADPGTGGRSALSLPRSVIAASWAPDDEAFAYIGRPAGGGNGPWRLYAGATVADAASRAVPMPPQVVPSQLLGWRDARHVVVGHHRTTVHVVDVVTGEVVEQSLAGSGKQLHPPLLAGDLWQHPLAPAVAPVGTTDPRRPWRWGGGALLVALAGALVLRRWWAGAA